MSTIVTMAILAVIGCYFLFKVILPQLKANMSGISTEAAKEYGENKEAIQESYYSDMERFGLFKQVIPDEQIKGITSYAEPKTVGNRLKESLKTTITNIEKVNMDLFYAVITDKSLHFIEFNGKNSVDHQIFDLQEIQGMKLSKSGRLNVKDHMAGVAGGLNKMKFHYKGEDYEFNLFDFLFGFPKFTVNEDVLSNSFSHVFCMPMGGMEVVSSKEYYIDGLLRYDLQNNFKTEVQNRFRVTF